MKEQCRLIAETRTPTNTLISASETSFVTAVIDVSAHEIIRHHYPHINDKWIEQWSSWWETACQRSGFRTCAALQTNLVGGKQMMSLESWGMGCGELLYLKWAWGQMDLTSLPALGFHWPATCTQHTAQPFEHVSSFSFLGQRRVGASILLLKEESPTFQPRARNTVHTGKACKTLAAVM